MSTIDIRPHFLKIGDNILSIIFNKVLEKRFLNINLRGNNSIFFHNAPQYWIRATNYIPYFWNEKDGQKTSVQIKSISLENSVEAVFVNSILNSSLFYIWFISLSDCRHLNMREIENFPVSLTEVGTEILKKQQINVRKLMLDYEKNKNRKILSIKQRVTLSMMSIIQKNPSPSLMKLTRY